MGEIRPTFSIESKPRYLRGLERVSAQALDASPTAIPIPATPPVPTPRSANTREEKPQPVYAKPGHALVQALRMVWPIVCRRLEGIPNRNAMQLQDTVRRVNLWRQDARARGVVIGPRTYRLSDKPRGRRPDNWLGVLQVMSATQAWLTRQPSTRPSSTLEAIDL